MMMRDDGGEKGKDNYIYFFRRGPGGSKRGQCGSKIKVYQILINECSFER